jgi:hypothetical protein
MLTLKYRLVLTALSAGALLVAGWGQGAIAQSQGDSTQSVAEAARRAREQKKNAAKPVKTLTNDDLPAAPAAAATEANRAGAARTPADSAAAAPSNDGGRTEPVPPNEEKAKLKKAEDAAALERAKKELATSVAELDVMQRKAALDSDSYYSKTGFAGDTAGKANLEAEAQQISDKKQAVEALKALIAELQAAIGEPPAAQPDKNTPPL